MALIRIYRDLLRGKSVSRALQNDALAPRLSALTGRVLDLAGGSGSYYAHLPVTLEIVRTNRDGRDGTNTVDMNAPLPYPDASFDAVLLLNALYIAPEPGATLSEIRRVLKPDGVALLTTPLIANEMREPHDYARFTSEGLGRLASEAGFAGTELVPIGERFTSALNLIAYGPLQPLAWPLMIPALALDRVMPRKLKRVHPAPWGYLSVLHA